MNHYKQAALCVAISLFGSTIAAVPASAKQNINKAATSRKSGQNGFDWKIADNVTFGLSGYVQMDAYNLSNTSAPDGMGTGPGGNKTIDAYFRRAILAAHGKIYNWGYLFAYEFAHSTRNAIIWAWVNHKLGPGQLYIGQHWTYTSLEEPLPGKALMFLERNTLTSNGLTALRDHDYGLFYKISQPFGSGDNNIFSGSAAYILRNPVLYGGSHYPRDERRRMIRAGGSIQGSPGRRS